MRRYVGLLRAVNVGGLKLPMAELKAMSDAAGFEAAQTYIASGNVVFRSALSEVEVKAALEPRLKAFAGKSVPVMVRSPEALEEVIAANPFGDAKPNLMLVLFLDEPPPADTLDEVRHQNGERIALGKREIYIDYSGGVGTSKLAFPAMKLGTARNLNTVRKLADMAAAL